MDTSDIMALLMAAYDRQCPDATPFARGAVKFEYNKTLEALNEVGLTVVGKPDATLDLDAVREQANPDEQAEFTKGLTWEGEPIDYSNELAHRAAKASGLSTRKPRK